MKKIIDEIVAVYDKYSDELDEIEQQKNKDALKFKEEHPDKDLPQHLTKQFIHGKILCNIAWDIYVMDKNNPLKMKNVMKRKKEQLISCADSIDENGIDSPSDVMRKTEIDC